MHLAALIDAEPAAVHGARDLRMTWALSVQQLGFI